MEKLRRQLPLKKKSSTNTSTMFLLYIIMNLCIAGKLNKILIYKSVFFYLLPYRESFMGEKPLRLNLRIFGIEDNQKWRTSGRRKYQSFYACIS